MSNYTHDYTAEYLSLFKKSGLKIQISDAAVLEKIGAAPASHIDVHASDTDYGHVLASSTLPLANGTAAVGTSLAYARADHVHPAQTAATAELADFAKALKNPFMLYLEGAVTAEDRVDGNTDVHLRVIKLDATALEGIIKVDNLPVGTGAGTIAAGDHTHDYSGVYAALNHGHAISDVSGLQNALGGKSDTGHTHSGADITSGTVGFSYLPTGIGSNQVAIGNHTHSSYAASSHGHAITSLTLSSAQSDLPGGSTTPATDSGWLFLASDNNALYNEHPHWARLTPTHIYIADAITGSTGHSIIINEKGAATLSSIGVSQSTNPVVIGMLPSSVSNSDSITPFDLYDYAAAVNHNHSGVYAPATHSHDSSDISDLSTVLSTALSGYSQTGHAHAALSAGSGLKYASNGQTYTGTDARTLSVDVGTNFSWTGTHTFSTAPKLKISGILTCAGTSSNAASINKVNCSTNGYVLKYNNGYTFGPITKGMLPGDFHYREHTYLTLLSTNSSSSPAIFTHNAGTDQTVYLIIHASTSNTEFYVRIPSPSTNFAGDQINFIIVNAHTSDTPYEPIINFLKTDTSNDLVIGEQQGTSGISASQLRISTGEMLILNDISTTAEIPTLNLWRAQKISETGF